MNDRKSLKEQPCGGLFINNDYGGRYITEMYSDFQNGRWLTTIKYADGMVVVLPFFEKSNTGRSAI